MKKKSKKVKKSSDSLVSKSDYESPVGKVTQVDDFLPAPEVLFVNDNRVKITIEVEGATLDFFRDQAQKTGNKYQRLMREVLKRYAQKYSA